MAAGGELQNLISEMRNSVSGLEVSQVKAGLSQPRILPAPGHKSGVSAVPETARPRLIQSK